MNIERYLHASRRATDALLARLRPDGSFGSEADDLCCYYKAPTALFLGGHLPEAHRVLDHIKAQYQAGLADTRSPILHQFRAYMAGWIAMGAQRMGRFGIAGILRAYLRSFSHPNGGFTTEAPFADGDGGVDMLTTAHLGLAALYFGMPDRALAAGELLAKFLEGQPEDAMLLRMDTHGDLVSNFEPDVASVYRISRHVPMQPFFMVGYPAAFLAKLYLTLNHPHELTTARRYLDFALSCEGVDEFHYSHKVAWGAALVARHSGEDRYARLATRIADHLLDMQEPDGMWLSDAGPHVSLDQTAENAVWLREMAAELGGFPVPGFAPAGRG